MKSGHVWQQYLDLCSTSGPLEQIQARSIDDPIAVGAVGGSGTRLVRNMLLSLGVDMMNGVNPAGDAHAWPPMQWVLASDAARFSSREVLCSHAFSTLEFFLQEHAQRIGHEGPVGWKVPETFLWLPELAGYFPGLRYVHVIRHGLDMAYTKNIRQFQNLHWYFGVQTHDMGQDGNLPVERERVLDYWIRSNRFALQRCHQALPGRHYLLVYDRLCQQPLQELAQLVDFLQLRVSAPQLEEAAGQVNANPSIGRFREQDWQADFRPDQLAAVQELGFTV